MKFKNHFVREVMKDVPRNLGIHHVFPTGVVRYCPRDKIINAIYFLINADEMALKGKNSGEVIRSHFQWIKFNYFEYTDSLELDSIYLKRNIHADCGGDVDEYRYHCTPPYELFATYRYLDESNMEEVKYCAEQLKVVNGEVHSSFYTNFGLVEVPIKIRVHDGIMDAEEATRAWGKDDGFMLYLIGSEMIGTNYDPHLTYEPVQELYEL